MQPGLVPCAAMWPSFDDEWQEGRMKTRHWVIQSRELIVVNAEGVLDLGASRRALRDLAASPERTEFYEVLMDLRDADCKLSTLDVYELAAAMAWPEPMLPTRRKVAVLVSEGEPFDLASFLELCAGNRGMRIRAFTDADAAAAWLETDLSGSEAES